MESLWKVQQLNKRKPPKTKWNNNNLQQIYTYKRKHETKMCVFVVALKIVKHVIKQRIIYKYKIYIKFLISTLCAKLDRQKLLLFLGSFLHYLAVFRLEWKKKQ